MRITRITGLSVLAAFAFSAVAVSSASAGLLFIAHPVGALVLGRALSKPIYKSAPGKEMVCEEANNRGKIAALRSLFQLVTVVYGGCIAFGQKADITPAQLLVSADGLVIIENTITVTVLELGFGCKVMFAPQHLTKVKFINSGPTMLRGVSEVTGIRSTTTGGFCGGESTEGTYSGNSELLVDAPGGLVQVD